MTTLRGSFRALHRLIVRRVRTTCTALGHPWPLHPIALRCSRGLKLVSPVPMPATALTSPALSAPIGAPVTTAPLAPDESEREQLGFIVPAADEASELLDDQMRRGAQTRALIDARQVERRAALQAPVLALVPEEETEQEVSDELRDTSSAIGKENTPALPTDIVQEDSDSNNPLFSLVYPVRCAEAGDDSSAAWFATPDDTPHPVSRTRKTAPKPSKSARDMEALKLIVRLRLLSYRGLRNWLFPGDPSTVGRSMQRLASREWVALHMDYLTLGGHPIYAFPTAKAMRWAREEFLHEIAGTEHEKLVKAMLPNAAKTLSIPQPRSAPAYLPHQELTNDIAFALEHDSKLRIPWLSTWPRPFPHAYGSLQLPQPDLVFVARVNDAPHLFFGELDHNSNESVAHFEDRKSWRAQAFDRSNELHALTGFMTFRMLVVIADTKDPIGRMQKLIEATRRAGSSHVLAFTLMPWLLRNPSGAIWFADGARPEHQSLTAEEHRGLKKLEELARKPETIEEILARERRKRGMS